MSVYTPLLGHIWRTLQSYGVDPAQAIDETLYRPGMSNSHAGRISFEDWDKSLANAVALIDDPAVGIRAAKYMLPTYLGALGHAWMASSTLRAALQRLERYRHMFNEQVELQVQELPDQITVTYLMQRQASYPDLLGDTHIASILQLCRLIFGPELIPIEVRLIRSEPQAPAPWLDFFGTPVRFGQTENQLSISAKDADTHLTGADSNLIDVHEEIIQRHLLNLSRNNILNRARLLIMDQLPSGRVTEDNIAGLLNMTKRTLHRKLAGYNKTFRALLTEVKKDLSERYIRNLDYSITEVAFLLGYTDSSAFSRAFKTWFDCSPTQARESFKTDPSNR